MRTLLAGLTVCCLLAADNAQDAVKKDLDQMAGDWSIVGAEHDGQPSAAEDIKNGKRIGKGNETTVTINDQLLFRARFTIDPKRKPKAIDYTVIDGAWKDMTVLGIYEIDGDALKFCLAPPGRDRPTEFKTKPGGETILVVWKRVKQ